MQRFNSRGIPAGAGIMSEVGCKSQEEYEDDFEKDLDWLISEESRIEQHGPDYEELEAQIDKELQKDEKLQEHKRRTIKEKKRGNRTEEIEGDEERWPSPMEPLQYDSERDSPDRLSPIAPPPPDIEDQTDQDKEYILEKIQQANRELQDQEAPDMTRRRRLHFKEKLEDLLVPPLKFEKDDNIGEVEVGEGSKDRAKDSDTETEVSGKLSELKLSSRKESSGSGGSGTAGECSEGRQGVREGRVLVEKDGKFDLVSLNEVESQGLLPPITNHYNDYLQQTMSSSKIGRSSSSPRPPAGSSPFQHGAFHHHTPRPPAHSRSRPNSAIHSQSRSHSNESKRRVKSATGTTCNATYTLSPQQKELQQRIQERKERLAREAEQKKHEEDEQKKQDNELAFKAWLMRKKEQFQDEKRIHQAQEIERMNTKGCISMSRQQKDSSDAELSFRMWVQRKQEQQHRERQMSELKKMEEDSGYFLHTREECERAFKLWLRRKRAEKRAEQQVARERSRRLVLEERRARRMRDLLCNVNETKPFRFTEQLVWPY